jgi:hypothetical protein
MLVGQGEEEEEDDEREEEEEEELDEMMLEGPSVYNHQAFFGTLKVFLKVLNTLRIYR